MKGSWKAQSGLDTSRGSGSIKLGYAILTAVLALLLPVMLIVLVPGSAGASEASYYTDSWYDGSLMASDIADSYATAHDASDANSADWGGTGFYIGQQRVGGGAPYSYYIWRGGLYFDTSGIPERATITAATVYLYGKSDNSSVDFDIGLVRGSELTRPPSVENYGQLVDETTWASGTVNTSSFSTSAYNTFTLTGQPGIDDIIIGGYTRFGIRSGEDISESAPAGDEYVEFWASEGTLSKRPKLVITYTLGELEDQPDPTMEIGMVEVFSGYIDDGGDDFLFVFNYKVIYESEPVEAPEDCFIMTIYDGTTLKAIMPLPAWGYKPGGIYVASGLTWGHDYEIRVTGRSDIFTTPPEETYTLTADDWNGANLDVLDRWVRASAVTLSSFYGETWLEEVSGEYKLNQVGSTIYTVGVPYLAAQRPDVFTYSESEFDWGEGAQGGTTPGEIDEDLGDWTRFGATLTTSFDEIGDVFDIDGTAVAALMFALLMGAVVGVVFWKTGNSTAGIVCALPLLMLGNHMGVIPLALTATVGAILAVLLAREVWLRGV